MSALVLWSVASFATAQVVLITEDEAKTPNAQIISTRAITRGPSIKLTSPADVAAKSFPIKLELAAKGGAKIDTNSLKVEYLKQPLVDLTPRFKPGLQANSLELSQVKVPQGQHAIRISIKDSDGREGTQTINLQAK